MFSKWKPEFQLLKKLTIRNTSAIKKRFFQNFFEEEKAACLVCTKYQQSKKCFLPKSFSRVTGRRRRWGFTVAAIMHFFNTSIQTLVDFWRYFLKIRALYNKKIWKKRHLECFNSYLSIVWFLTRSFAAPQNPSRHWTHLGRVIAFSGNMIWFRVL